MQNFFKLKKQSSSKREGSFYSKGFSLIELLVTLSIFAIITMIVLVRNSSFNSSIFINNLAYDVALSIRQAQFYSLSVREFNTGNFDVSYGVYFDPNSTKDFVLFADRNENGHYDTNDSSEILETYNITQGNSISNLCAKTVAGVVKCTNLTQIKFLEIMFKRPDLDAIIKTDNDSESYQSAGIVLQSPANKNRSVKILSTGQISIVPTLNL